MGLAYRVIARLDIKAPNVIKPMQFDGLRVVGDPVEMAQNYVEQGADEILYLDIVASLYGRNQLERLIEQTTEKVFVPVTVAGGIASVGQVRRLLNAGADRVAVNSAAIKRPDLIREISDHFGSQSLAVSIEAKRVPGGWEAYTDAGRERTGKCVLRWADEAQRLGAGELLVTSIDCDGTRRGADMRLLDSIQADVPVIYSGGVRIEDARAVAAHSDGVAIGASLHYGDCTIAQVKDELRGCVEIR